MENTWKVDMNRLIKLVAERMYSDPIKAGIRELITNGLDARKGIVEICIDYDDIQRRLRYTDSGVGIDPESFKNIYGKIASGHKRRKGSRGFFGIGRMSLIAASKKGMIMSYKDGKVYTWKFNRKGWSGPEIMDDKDEIGHGVYIHFDGIEIENLGEIERWIRKTFSVPLARHECLIRFQMGEIYTLIGGLWTEYPKIRTKNGPVELYVKEETDGTLYVCQKGILVKEESYTGLSAYVDQGFLEIKTDREGFVNNSKYRQFNSRIKKELAKIRPHKSFEKMEVDFIRRLMKEFKRYWITKAKKAEPIPEKIQIEFPETGKEIVTKEEQVPEIVSEHVPDLKVPNIDDPSMEGIKKEMKIWDDVPDEPLPEAIPTDIKAIEMEEKSSVSWDGQKPLETRTVEDEKIVKIRGAKPVDMGEDYPMVFFETNPFVLVFNTSHPVFKQLVEKGKLSSAQLAVLFERMFECAYTDKFPVEDPEELKKRWKEVDLKLKEIFK